MPLLDFTVLLVRLCIHFCSTAGFDAFADYMSRQNIPFVSSTGVVITDYSRYRTLARLSSLASTSAQMGVEILLQYGWRKIGVVVADNVSSLAAFLTLFNGNVCRLQIEYPQFSEQHHCEHR